MGLEDMVNRAVDILYSNFSSVASKPQLTRQLKKNMSRARRRTKVHMAKMWIRYMEKKQRKLMEEQKVRNGWDKDPVLIQVHRAALMMPFSEYSVEQLFPNSMYAYYKKIVREDAANRQKQKFLERMRMEGIQNGESDDDTPGWSRGTEII